MKTIVLGYDDSDPAKRALEKAAKLATAFGAKVIVTSVAPRLVGRAGSPWTRRTHPTSTSRSSCAQLHSSTSTASRVTTTSRWPTRLSHIVELAEKRGADLIVVGTHERSFLERLLWPSVSRKVERKAHCDVMIVH